MAGGCEGRVALVTGASRGGTGTATAVRLAAEGADVAVTARTVVGLEECRDRIVALGRRCLVLPADMGDPGVRGTLVARTERELGPVDILVNSAAIGGYKPFEKWSADELSFMMQVNVWGPWQLMTQGQGISVNALTPQAAIATPALVRAGWIDEVMFEPLETMAEAALALITGDPNVLTGRIAFSLQLLLELQRSVYDLHGRHLVEGCNRASSEQRSNGKRQTFPRADGSHRSTSTAAAARPLETPNLKPPESETRSSPCQCESNVKGASSSSRSSAKRSAMRSIPS